jgi:hypothetical protein
VEQKIFDKLGELGARSADRRSFLKQAGKAAAAVPAVALLLSANATPAAASGRYGKGKGKKKHKPVLKGKGGARKYGKARKPAFGFKRH